MKKYIVYALVLAGLYLMLMLLYELTGLSNIEFLGGGYVYCRSSSDITGQCDEQIDIPNEVISYNYNFRYIVAKQYLHHGIIDTTMYNTPWHLYKQADEYYYWIIDKSHDSVYGPMDSVSFTQMCSVLKGLPIIDSNIASTY